MNQSTCMGVTPDAKARPRFSSRMGGLSASRFARSVVSGLWLGRDQMNATATTPKYVEILRADYVSDYKIRLRFNDGKTQVVDFGPFLAKARNPDTTDYRDLERFRSFRIDHGDLVWGDLQMIFPIMDLYRGEI
jgi:hypothetical protein